MEATLGNPDAITANNVLDVFHGMQEKLIERVTKEKDDHYAQKVAELEAQISDGGSTVAALRESLTTLGLDKEAVALEAEELKKQTVALAEESAKQEKVVAEQSERIERLADDVKRLSDGERNATEKLLAHRRRAEAAATRYADRGIFIVRVVGALLPVIGIGLVSVYDKFLLEQLRPEYQTLGKWGFIGAQVLLGVALAGVFIDWAFTKRLERWWHRIYSARLLLLGFDEDGASHS
jgi:regulator of replication initiation timing